MSKLLKEDCRNFSIYKLREWGYLDGGSKWGNINWTNTATGKKNDISFTLNLGNGKKNIILKYTITDRYTEEKKEINQEYSIVSTPCNYGNVRYWFVCSVYTNKVYCGRRVAKLYLGGGSYYFACRHCYNLSYEVRNELHYRRAFGKIVSEPELEEMRENIYMIHYNGKMTKRYKRYLEVERKQYLGMMYVINYISRGLR